VSIDNLHSTLYANAGHPAITVPLGLREGSSTPAGITFIGRRGEDGALLAMAYAFEQATRLRIEPRLDYTLRP
jgi:amidase